MEKPRKRAGPSKKDRPRRGTVGSAFCRALGASSCFFMALAGSAFRAFSSALASTALGAAAFFSAALRGARLAGAAFSTAFSSALGAAFFGAVLRTVLAGAFSWVETNFHCWPSPSTLSQIWAGAPSSLLMSTMSSALPECTLTIFL